MVVAVACASASPSTSAPTPVPATDVPIFADGEAVAVVKTFLSQMTYDSVRTVTDTKRFSFPKSTDPVVGVTTITRNCLSPYQGGGFGPAFDWSGEYLGNGVWLVAAEANDRRSSWKVYERTLAVDSIQSAFQLTIPTC